MVDRTPKRRGEPLEQSSKRARSTTGRVGIREQEGSEHEESDEEEDGGGGGVVAAELMHDLDSEDTEAGRGGVGSHERADAVDGGERAENADLDAQAAARSGEYAWIGELVKGGPCSFVKECSHIRTWRILPVKALRKVSKLLCKIGTTAISGPTEEDRELAWLAFFALPALLLRAKLREGSEVGPQRVEGAKPDQIIMERAIRAEKGRWTELVRELEVDIALQKAKKPGAAGQIASPGDPVSAAAADGFCRLASTGQHGKAARNVVQAPVIQPCEQLKESLPKKIYPAEETELSNLQLLRARVLQEQAPVEDVEKSKSSFARGRVTSNNMDKPGTRGGEMSILKHWRPQRQRRSLRNLRFNSSQVRHLCWRTRYWACRRYHRAIRRPTPQPTHGPLGRRTLSGGGRWGRR